jgi:hypothetical protein
MTSILKKNVSVKIVKFGRKTNLASSDILEYYCRDRKS